MKNDDAFQDLMNRISSVVKIEQTSAATIKLITNLTQLNESLQQVKVATRLSETAKPLLTKLCLLSLSVLNKGNNQSDSGKQIQAITQCVEQISHLLVNDKDEQAIKTLFYLADQGLCDHHIQAPWYKRYAFQGLDVIINGVNLIRSFVFRVPYAYSRLTIDDFISADLHRYVLIAQHSTKAVVPFEELLQHAPREGNDQLSHYLNLSVNDAFETLIKQHAFLKKDAEALLEALNGFGRIIVGIEDNLLLKENAKHAFLASQDLVLSLLTEKQPSLTKIKRLTACLQKVTTVICEPGDKDAVESLRCLMEESDIKRFKCDREKTCYAIIHIVAAAALLGLAVADTVISGGLNLLIEVFTLTAEGISLLVGVGQLGYFSSSQIEQTDYNHAMTDLFKATRLKFVTPDLQDMEAIGNEKKYQQLIESFKTLQQTAVNYPDPLMKQQAELTCQRAKEVIIDLFYNQGTLEQIKHLKYCLDTTKKLLDNPTDKEIQQKLIQLAEKGDYEQSRIDKKALLIGSMLLLVSVAIYVVTIAATVLSLGATAGTIISPIMLSALAINKIKQSLLKDRTIFSDEAKKLGQYSQLLFAAPREDANLEKTFKDNKGLINEVVC